MSVWRDVDPSMITWAEGVSEERRAMYLASLPTCVRIDVDTRCGMVLNWGMAQIPPFNVPAEITLSRAEAFDIMGSLDLAAHRLADTDALADLAIIEGSLRTLVEKMFPIEEG